MIGDNVYEKDQVSSCLAEGLWSPVTINCVVSRSNEHFVLLVMMRIMMKIDISNDNDENLNR